MRFPIFSINLGMYINHDSFLFLTKNNNLKTPNSNAYVLFHLNNETGRQTEEGQTNSRSYVHYTYLPSCHMRPILSDLQFLAFHPNLPCIICRFYKMFDRHFINLYSNICNFYYVQLQLQVHSSVDMYCQKNNDCFSMHISKVIILGAHFGLLFSNAYQQQKKILLNQQEVVPSTFE